MSRLTWLVVALVCTGVLNAQAVDSKGLFERSEALIESGEYVAARSFLGPALIDPALHPTERSKAYYLRGYAYAQSGLPVSARKDYYRALEFNRANPAVLVALGVLYARGEGVAQDAVRARDLFDQAADLGLADGYFYAGRARLLGEGAQIDLTEAQRRLLLAAEQGHARAMRQLAASYRVPFSDPAQPEQAAAWYEKAFAAGDADGYLALGHMVLKNETAGDLTDALRYFEQAAEAGSSAAQARLAYQYLNGDGFEANPQAAFRYYGLAARQGNVDGALGLAYLYGAGVGVAEDQNMALHWNRRAAEGGSLRGMLDAAATLAASDDPADEREALLLYQQASASGDARAANGYAWLLASSSHDAHRNGEQAVRFAEYAVARGRTVSRLDTLAAALAEDGRFEDAVATQEEALQLAENENEASRAALAARLTRYRNGLPWRE